jgi:hypothetical protein
MEREQMEEINKTNDGAAHKAAEKSSRRNMIKLFGAGAVGVVAGGVGLKCCSPISLPQCATSPQQGRLNVIVHRIMIIHVQDDPKKATNGTITLIIPAIDQHSVLAGPLSNLQCLTAGDYSLNSLSTADKAYIFDPTRQILVRASYKRDAMTYVNLVKSFPAGTVTITMPRPGLYNPFRAVVRKLNGNFYDHKYLQTVDFPMGHVLNFAVPSGTPTLTGHNTNISATANHSGFDNFHVFNQSPMGPHNPVFGSLNNLFAISGDAQTTSVDINMDTDPRPAPPPGCDLESIGIGAADECDLSQLAWYGYNYCGASRVSFIDKITGRDHPLDGSSPASCVSYVYDECGSNNPG